MCVCVCVRACVCVNDITCTVIITLYVRRCELFWISTDFASDMS